ncbi:MAG: hypothetical protein ACRD9S_01370 [Pyrinomonadaceae bacterium]
MIDSKTITNPFPGLRPFETDEYGLFFGREGQSDALIARLQRSHFLAVVGTSGSGKSSLVRAGLLPALRGGMMAGAGSGWRIAIMRPGSDPIGNLASALAQEGVLLEAGGGLPPAETEAIIEAALRRGSLGLVDGTRQARLQPHEKLLVVVDQFEELFRFRAARPVSSTGDDASAFVKLLLEAAQQPDLPIYIVPTMRSDFLGDCAQFQGLPEAINDGQYLIPRMTRDERRFAITGPVGVKRCKISEPLVNRLMNDVGDNPDQLPILQHALMRTWGHWAANSRDGEPIGLEHYETIGTMSDALSKHADEAYDELPDDRSRLVAEALFKALTERGADNRELRRPTCLRDIRAIAGASAAEISAVVEVFRAPGRSFLMPPAGVALESETVIDISHESLIRNWERLKVWVRDEAEAARIYRRLAGAAADYRAGIGGLLDEVTLRYALKWREQHKPNHAWGVRYHPEFDESIAYLEESQAASNAAQAARECQQAEQVERERRELEQTRAFAEKQARSAKRMRRLTAALGVILVVALGATAMAFKARADALRNREQMVAALQRNSLIRQGLEALGQDHSDQALQSFDCLSQNLQKLLPQSPHLPHWTDGPCDEMTAVDKYGQLEVQLAWAYSNLGSTFSSIADQDWLPAAEVSSDDAGSLGHPEGAKPEEVRGKKYYASRALDAYEQAVRILERTAKDDDPDMRNAYNGLAHAYHNAALIGYQPAADLQKKEVSTEEYFRKADETYNRVLKIEERRIEIDPADAAAEHVSLARLYRDMKKDVEVEEHFRKAAELWKRSARLKEVSGDVSEEDSTTQEIVVLRELAEHYLNLNRFEDAEKAHDQIIDIQENYDLSRGNEIADSYNELGQIYQAQNNANKAATAFRLANILQHVALKYRRKESSCLGLLQLAPVYFKLGRYLQIKQAYDIVIEDDRGCMETRAAEAERLLNQSLDKLAVRRGPDSERSWQDEDGIYETLIALKPEDKETERDQIFSRRLKNMARRYTEITKQPDGIQDETQFLDVYGRALSAVGEFYKGKDQDQAEVAYQLAFNALDLVKRSTDPSVFDTYAYILENYGALLLQQNKSGEAAAVNDAAKGLREKQAELEKKNS